MVEMVSFSSSSSKDIKLDVVAGLVGRDFCGEDVVEEVCVVDAGIFGGG